MPNLKLDPSEIEKPENGYRISGMCFIESICHVTGYKFEDVYHDLFTSAMEHYIMPNDVRQNIAPYLDKHGFTLTTFKKGEFPLIGDILEYHIDDTFIFMLANGVGFDRCVNHAVAYKDHTFYDSKSKKFPDEAKIMFNLQIFCPMYFIKRK